MALRSLYCITGLALLAALPLCAASGPQTAVRPDTDQSIPAQNPGAASAISSATSSAPPSATQQSVAPVAPTLAEMRAMNAEQLDEAGDQLRQVKDYLAALDCYREAIRKHANAEYYNKVAVAELLLRHPAEAAKAAKKALRKDKGFAQAWNNLGVSYYMRRQYDDAIHAYERAISLMPDFASYHNNLAATLMDSKQIERGAAEYRKAFELDPSFFEHASQNGISAHMGSPQDRAQFAFVMARLFAGTGNYDRALHFLRSAMEDGYPNINDVYRDKEFAPVRNDERFLALMKERPVAIR
jgi:tetratricopeptide (TPR) repeat protein